MWTVLNHYITIKQLQFECKNPLDRCMVFCHENPLDRWRPPSPIKTPLNYSLYRQQTIFSSQILSHLSPSTTPHSRPNFLCFFIFVFKAFRGCFILETTGHEKFCLHIRVELKTSLRKRHIRLNLFLTCFCFAYFVTKKLSSTEV